MTISFIFLAVYIEFEKLLGNDDQNNVKHLYSVIKKKEICHLTSPNWVFWHVYKDKNVRIDHRIWNSLIAGGVFNYFFGYGFIFIYNLCVC